MTLSLHNLNKNIVSDLQITGSKSESNRLLILQALYPEIQIENLSNSDDTQVLKKALEQGHGVIDIHHAGTAMRFLT
ncbi:MAG: 3-phosphoshikimate 1-carboxyvinyltransferase, partial [Christiangramia sp.]